MSRSLEKPGACTTDTDSSQLLSVAVTVLRQGLDLVDNVLSSDEQLTVASKLLPGSTIGKHLRHVREHFQLLLACASTTPPRTLSYDARPRHTVMESSLHYARKSLTETIEALAESVPKIRSNEPLTLNAVTPFSQTFETTFGREIRAIAGEMNIELQQDFGFAPSTLVHQGRGVILGKAKM